MAIGSNGGNGPVEEHWAEGGMDEGYVRLDGPGSLTGFIETCRAVRSWPREELVDQT